MFDQLNNLIKNDVFKGAMFVFTAMYAGLASTDSMNEFMRNLMNNPLSKMIAYGVIGYMATKNVEMSIFLAIVFYLTLYLINDRTVKEQFACGCSLFNTGEEFIGYDDNENAETFVGYGYSDLDYAPIE